MNLIDWWQKVDDNWVNLLGCIERFHPCYNSDIPVEVLRDQILAESACESIRREVRKGKNIDSPIVRAENAKINRDIGLLSTILSETWFGSPESRSVYSVAGFSILCSLLDDPPDGIEYDENDNLIKE